jgi:ADP-heptose:LPS heptosyltransferase
MAIAAAARPQPLVAPLLSLRELGELFRRCRVVLSVDTGPMHLASAVGAPVVALFGPKDPRVYGPCFGPRALIEKPLDCRPCRKRSCDDPKCMHAIVPDDVIAGAERVLRNP